MGKEDKPPKTLKSQAKAQLEEKSTSNMPPLPKDKSKTDTTTTKKSSKTKPDFLSEAADLQFVELVKERLQMGREVQYFLEDENKELKSENEELKKKIKNLEKELNSVKNQVMSTLSALGSVDLADGPDGWNE